MTKLQFSLLRYAASLIAMSVVFATPSYPNTITYTVSRTVGSGSVTGFITTDGTLGTLSTSDITNWHLTLFDGTLTFDIYGPLSGNNSVVQIQGADVSATATQLLFNFSGVDNGFLLFQKDLYSGQHYYCDATDSSTCLTGESVVPGAYGDPTYQNVARSGNLVIGNVPEPASLTLLASALVALGGLRRQKVRNWQ